jgi:hypothetical protein
MAEEQSAVPENSPDTAVALVRTLDQMRIHSEQLTALSHELTEFVAKLSARVSGTEAVAGVVDENAAQAATERQIAAQKELISHLYEKSQQYVTVVVAGAYAAYFATLSTVSARFSDSELRLSALLMTISLTIFVLWEVFNVAFLGWNSLRGDFGVKAVPRWYRILWPLMLAASVLTALPAVGYSLHSYTSGLISPPSLTKVTQTSSTSRP